jgi:hypothetical protein
MLGLDGFSPGEAVSLNRVVFGPDSKNAFWDGFEKPAKKRAGMEASIS